MFALCSVPLFIDGFDFSGKIVTQLEKKTNVFTIVIHLLKAMHIIHSIQVHNI